jgi:hypothetical protein
VSDHNGGFVFVGILLGLSIAFLCQKVPKPRAEAPAAVTDTLIVPVAPVACAPDSLSRN